MIGGPPAMTAACLCITRYLESVASGRAGVSTWEDRRRRIIFELILCIGIPALIMGLHIIVQGHRFDIRK